MTRWAWKRPVALVVGGVFAFGQCVPIAYAQEYLRQLPARDVGSFLLQSDLALTQSLKPYVEAVGEAAANLPRETHTATLRVTDRGGAFRERLTNNLQAQTGPLISAFRITSEGNELILEADYRGPAGNPAVDRLLIDAVAQATRGFFVQVLEHAATQLEDDASTIGMVPSERAGAQDLREIAGALRGKTQELAGLSELPVDDAQWRAFFHDDALFGFFQGAWAELDPARMHRQLIGAAVDAIRPAFERLPSQERTQRLAEATGILEGVYRETHKEGTLPFEFWTDAVRRLTDLGIDAGLADAAVTRASASTAMADASYGSTPKPSQDLLTRIRNIVNAEAVRFGTRWEEMTPGSSGSSMALGYWAQTYGRDQTRTPDRLQQAFREEFGPVLDGPSLRFPGTQATLLFDILLANSVEEIADLITGASTKTFVASTREPSAPVVDPFRDGRTITVAPLSFLWLKMQEASTPAALAANVADQVERQLTKDAQAAGDPVLLAQVEAAYLRLFREIQAQSTIVLVPGTLPAGLQQFLSSQLVFFVLPGDDEVRVARFHGGGLIDWTHWERDPDHPGVIRAIAGSPEFTTAQYRFDPATKTYAAFSGGLPNPPSTPKPIAEQAVAQLMAEWSRLRPGEFVQTIAGAQFISRRVEKPAAKVLSIEPLDPQVIDRLHARGDIDYDVLHPASELTRNEQGEWAPISREQFLELAKAGDYTALIKFVHLPLSAELFDAMPKVRFIALFSRGYDKAMAKMAAERGVLMSYIPGDLLTNAMAELNTMLALDGHYHITESISTIPSGQSNLRTLERLTNEATQESITQLLWGQVLRQVLRYDAMLQLVADRKFVKPAGVGPLATVLHDQLARDDTQGVHTSLAILGATAITQRLAEIAQAHEVETIRYFAPQRLPEEEERRLGLTYVTLEDALQSDYVINVPESGVTAPSDRASSRLIDASRLVLNDGFDALLNSSLWNQSQAIVGLGQIGTATAQRAIALGMHILTPERGGKDATIAALDARQRAFAAAHGLGPQPVRMLPKRDIFRLGHVITVDLPETPETVGYIGAEDIAMIEDPHAVIVSTGRGSVLKEGEVADSLRQRPGIQLRADVRANELRDTHLGLAELPNVKVSGHTGSAVIPIRRGMMRVAVVDNLLEHLDGRTPKNLVPEMQQLPAAAQALARLELIEQAPQPIPLAEKTRALLTGLWAGRSVQDVTDALMTPYEFSASQREAVYSIVTQLQQGTVNIDQAFQQLQGLAGGPRRPALTWEALQRIRFPDYATVTYVLDTGLPPDEVRVAVHARSPAAVETIRGSEATPEDIVKTLLTTSSLPSAIRDPLVAFVRAEAPHLLRYAVGVQGGAPSDATPEPGGADPAVAEMIRVLRDAADLAYQHAVEVTPGHPDPVVESIARTLRQKAQDLEEGPTSLPEMAGFLRDTSLAAHFVNQVRPAAARARGGVDMSPATNRKSAATKALAGLELVEQAPPLPHVPPVQAALDTLTPLLHPEAVEEGRTELQEFFDSTETVAEGMARLAPLLVEEAQDLSSLTGVVGAALTQLVLARGRGEATPAAIRQQKSDRINAFLDNLGLTTEQGRETIRRELDQVHTKGVQPEFAASRVRQEIARVRQPATLNNKETAALQQLVVFLAELRYPGTGRRSPLESSAKTLRSSKAGKPTPVRRLPPPTRISLWTPQGWGRVEAVEPADPNHAADGSFAIVRLEGQTGRARFYERDFPLLTVSGAGKLVYDMTQQDRRLTDPAWQEAQQLWVARVRGLAYAVATAKPADREAPRAELTALEQRYRSLSDLLDRADRLTAALQDSERIRDLESTLATLHEALRDPMAPVDLASIDDTLKRLATPAESVSTSLPSPPASRAPQEEGALPALQPAKRHSTADASQPNTSALHVRRLIDRAEAMLAAGSGLSWERRIAIAEVITKLEAMRRSGSADVQQLKTLEKELVAPTAEPANRAVAGLALIDQAEPLPHVPPVQAAMQTLTPLLDPERVEEARTILERFFASTMPAAQGVAVLIPLLQEEPQDLSDLGGLLEAVLTQLAAARGRAEKRVVLPLTHLALLRQEALEKVQEWLAGPWGKAVRVLRLINQEDDTSAVMNLSGRPMDVPNFFKDFFQESEAGSSPWLWVVKLGPISHAELLRGALDALGGDPQAFSIGITVTRTRNFTDAERAKDRTETARLLMPLLKELAEQARPLPHVPQREEKPHALMDDLAQRIAAFVHQEPQVRVQAVPSAQGGRITLVIPNEVVNRRSEDLSEELAELAAVAGVVSDELVSSDGGIILTLYPPSGAAYDQLLKSLDPARVEVVLSQESAATAKALEGLALVEQAEPLPHVPPVQAATDTLTPLLRPDVVEEGRTEFQEFFDSTETVAEGMTRLAPLLREPTNPDHLAILDAALTKLAAARGRNEARDQTSVNPPRLRTIEQLPRARSGFLKANWDLPGLKADDVTKIEQSLDTIREMFTKVDEIFVNTHFGRPQPGEFDATFSLAPVKDAAARLRQEQGIDAAVILLPYEKERIAQAIADARAAHPGQPLLFLMENVRFYPEEKSKDPNERRAFGQWLKEITGAEVYINEAVDSSHNERDASMEMVELFAPERRAAGRFLEAEVTRFLQFEERAGHPRLYIFGGRKFDKLIHLRDLLRSDQLSPQDIIAVVGALAYPLLGASGHSVGESVMPTPEEAETLQLTSVISEIQRLAQEKGITFIAPKDHLIDTADHMVKWTDGPDVPEEHVAIGIGPKTLVTILDAIEAIRSSPSRGAVVFNGGAGRVDRVESRYATTAILTALDRLVDATNVPVFLVGGDMHEAVQIVEREDLGGRPLSAKLLQTTGGGVVLAALARGITTFGPIRALMAEERSLRERAQAMGMTINQIWRRDPHVMRPPDASGFSESLDDVIARAVPAYDQQVLPKLQAGESVLLSAHGNSLRSLAMQRWFGLTDSEIAQFTFPLGTLIRIRLDPQTERATHVLFVRSTEHGYPDPDKVTEFKKILDGKGIVYGEVDLSVENPQQPSQAMWEKLTAGATEEMGDLFIVRHGQSIWSETVQGEDGDRYAGWIDIPLTADGEHDAAIGGKLLRQVCDLTGVTRTAAYASQLQRGIRTRDLALEAAQMAGVPATNDWRFDEQHYGAMQGRKRKEFGAELVEIILRLWEQEPELITADAHTLAQRLHDRWAELTAPFFAQAAVREYNTKNPTGPYPPLPGWPWLRESARQYLSQELGIELRAPDAATGFPGQVFVTSGDSAALQLLQVVANVTGVDRRPDLRNEVWVSGSLESRYRSAVTLNTTIRVRQEGGGTATGWVRDFQERLTFAKEGGARLPKALLLSPSDIENLPIFERLLADCAAHRILLILDTTTPHPQTAEFLARLQHAPPEQRAVVALLTDFAPRILMPTLHIGTFVTFNTALGNAFTTAVGASNAGTDTYAQVILHDALQRQVAAAATNAAAKGETAPARLAIDSVSDAAILNDTVRMQQPDPTLGVTPLATLTDFGIEGYGLLRSAIEALEALGVTPEDSRWPRVLEVATDAARAGRLFLEPAELEAVLGPREGGYSRIRILNRRWVGVPGHPVPERLLRAAEEATLLTPEQAQALLPKLKAADRSYWQLTYQMAYTDDQVISTGEGSKVILQALFKAVARRHGTEEMPIVIIPTPDYVGYESSSLLSGIRKDRIVYAQTQFEHNFIATTGELDAAQEQTGYGTDRPGVPKILLITSPDNPTGAIVSRDQMRAFWKYAVEHDMLLVVDAAYGLLLFEEGPIDFNTLADEVAADNAKGASREEVLKHLVFLGTDSKEDIHPRTRRGKLAGSNTDLVRLTDSLIVQRSDAIANYVGLETYREENQAVFKAEVDAHAASLKRTKDLLEAAFQSPEFVQAGLRFVKVGGAFYFFWDPSSLFGRVWKGTLTQSGKALPSVAITDESSFERALVQATSARGILGSAFGKPGWYRDAFSGPIADTEEFIHELRRFLSELTVPGEGGGETPPDQAPSPEGQRAIQATIDLSPATRHEIAGDVLTAAPIVGLTPADQSRLGIWLGASSGEALGEEYMVFGTKDLGPVMLGRVFMRPTLPQEDQGAATLEEVARELFGATLPGYTPGIRKTVEFIPLSNAMKDCDYLTTLLAEHYQEPLTFVELPSTFIGGIVMGAPEPEGDPNSLTIEPARFADGAWVDPSGWELVPGHTNRIRSRASPRVVARWSHQRKIYERLSPDQAFQDALIDHLLALRPDDDEERPTHGWWHPIPVDRLATEYGVQPDAARTWLLTTGEFFETVPGRDDIEGLTEQERAVFTAPPGTLYFNLSPSGIDYIAYVSDVARHLNAPAWVASLAQAVGGVWRTSDGLRVLAGSGAEWPEHLVALDAQGRPQMALRATSNLLEPGRYNLYTTHFISTPFRANEIAYWIDLELLRFQSGPSEWTAIDWTVWRPAPEIGPGWIRSTVSTATAQWSVRACAFIAQGGEYKGVPEGGMHPLGEPDATAQERSELRNSPAARQAVSPAQAFAQRVEALGITADSKQVEAAFWAPQLPEVSGTVVSPDVAKSHARLTHPFWVVVHSSVYETPGSDAVQRRMLDQLDTLRGRVPLPEGLEVPELLAQGALRMALVVDGATTTEQASAYQAELRQALGLPERFFQAAVPGTLTAQQLHDVFTSSAAPGVPGSLIAGLVGPTDWLDRLTAAQNTPLKSVPQVPFDASAAPAGRIASAGNAIRAGIEVAARHAAAMAAGEDRQPPDVPARLDTFQELGLPQDYAVVPGMEDAIAQERQRRRAINAAGTKG